MIQKTSSIFFLIAVFKAVFLQATRSVHRPKENWMPRIEVNMRQSTRTSKNSLYASHMEASVLKKFDWDFLKTKLLPPAMISHRNHPEEYTSGKVLDDEINNLLDEIKDKKKEYRDFVVLKKLDFNRKWGVGLIVFKFKKYPFVLKLFIEKPETFVNPCSKGFQPYFFFFMGGGINRHLMGFTRIKNLEIIREAIKNDPRWSQIIDTPRKWFWLPREPEWLNVTAYNLNGVQEQSIEIPAVYAIVADWIKSTRNLSLRSKKSRTLGIKLSRIVGNRIDPHMGNFILEDLSDLFFEKSENSSQDKLPDYEDFDIDQYREKIVLIDTEHFPSLVGLKKPLEFDGYLSWYLQLMGKFAQEKFFRTKSYRKSFQLNPAPEYLAL